LRSALLYYRYADSAVDSIAPIESALVEAFNLTKNVFSILKQLNYDRRHNSKYEEIIFSSIYNQERRDLIIIITILEYMHDEILRNRKPC